MVCWSAINSCCCRIEVEKETPAVGAGVWYEKDKCKPIRFLKLKYCVLIIIRKFCRAAEWNILECSREIVSHLFSLSIIWPKYV